MPFGKRFPILKLIFIVGGIFLFAPTALAVCDNVPLDSVKLVTNLEKCKSYTNDSQYISCFAEVYKPLCFYTVRNQGQDQITANDICEAEALECAQKAVSVSVPQDGGSSGGGSGGTGSGTGGGSGSGGQGSSGSGAVGTGCDTQYFDNVNGLCVPKSNFNQGSLAGSNDWKELIKSVIKWLLMLVGVIAVVAIIIGGYWYITSAGNEEQAEKGRKVLTNAIIGVVVVIMAYAIVTVVTNMLTNK